MWLEFDGTLPTDTPASLSIKVEANATSNDIAQKIYAFNFDTSAWELLDTSETGFINDSVVEVETTGDILRFVENGTGKVRTKITYTQGPSAIFLVWAVCLDQVIWTVNQ